jgi:hypothetical protein
MYLHHLRQQTVGKVLAGDLYTSSRQNIITNEMARKQTIVLKLTGTDKSTGMQTLMKQQVKRVSNIKDGTRTVRAQTHQYNAVRKQDFVENAYRLQKA